jgi:hypothetical protein
MRRTKVVLVVFFALLLGAIVTHYVEMYEHRLAASIRSLVYPAPVWKEFDKVISLRRSFVDCALPGHPVRAALLIRGEVYRILSQHLEAPKVPILASETSLQGEVPEEGIKQRIIEIANWYLSIGESLKWHKIEALMIPYQFREHTYGIRPPWYSGMAQGMAGEVLLAAYYISGKRSTLKVRSW